MSTGDQLQPGVEDGGTPTEVAAEENKKIPSKRRALSTRERGQQKHLQPGLSNFYDCQNFLPWGYNSRCNTQTVYVPIQKLVEIPHDWNKYEE